VGGEGPPSADPDLCGRVDRSARRHSRSRVPASAGSDSASGRPASVSTGTAIPAAASCSRWSKNCARFNRFLIDSEGLSAVGPSHAASMWLPGAGSAQADGDARSGVAEGFLEAGGVLGVLWVMMRAKRTASHYGLARRKSITVRQSCVDASAIHARHVGGFGIAELILPVLAAERRQFSEYAGETLGPA